MGIGRSPSPDCKDIRVNDLNNFFTSSVCPLNPDIKSTTLKKLSILSSQNNGSSFDIAQITEEDVKKSVLAISSSAIGNDGLCSRMIVPILPLLLPILTHIFNFSIRTSSFPSAWKQAIIIPLPKTSKPSSVSHFRPISILPFLSKVLEHMIHRQLSNFISTSSLLSPYQSGFRSGHSTVTALIKVSDDIRMAMENKHLTLLVLLDFSSAFNSVDFDVLLRVLDCLNFSSSTSAWFSSYLRGRSQRVRLDDNLSDWCDIAAGVPQGGVLSPLLFSIFINSVTDVISSNFHLYADDLQLYRHFLVGNTKEAIEAINSDLNRINEWSSSFGLLVNPAKSQALIIGSKYQRSQLNIPSLPFIYFNGTPIPYADTAKNLGLIFDGTLSWKAHVAEVSRKVHYSLHSLKSLQNFLPLKTKISLAHTLIQPIIDYADVCFLDATGELINKLERLQNLAIRFIFGLKKFDRVSQFRKNLKWLPIRLRRNTRILCLLFKILHSPSSPTYLRDNFSFTHPPGVPCRSHLRTLLKFPSHKSSFYSHSFSVHSVRLWNSLPFSIRDCKTISMFKKRVKEYYLDLV